MEDFYDDQDLFVRKPTKPAGLTQEEQNELNSIIQENTPPAKKTKTAQILLKLSELIELIDS